MIVIGYTYITLSNKSFTIAQLEWFIVEMYVHVYTYMCTSSILSPISLASSVTGLGVWDRATSISDGTGSCNARGNTRKDHTLPADT